MPTGHAKAAVGDIVIAETETWQEVEGNVYFPSSSIKFDYLSKTELSTHCPWKGDASYYTIKAGDQELKNAAWYYASPGKQAEHIRDHIAFYKTKVSITKS